MDLTAWRDYVDVAVAAEGIGRRLKDFADSLSKYLDTQSCGFPLDMQCWLIDMSWRVSRHLYRALDYTLEDMLGYAEDLNASVEERAKRQAAYDQLRMNVGRHREEIAAIQPDQPSNIATSVTHNPEASFGKSRTIDHSFSCLKVCAKRQRRYRYGHVRVDQRGRRRCLFGSFPTGKHNDFELWFPVDFDFHLRES